jgi:hypothetical protein
MSEWDVLRCGLAKKVTRVFVARAALWAVQDCGPGNTAGLAALLPGSIVGIAALWPGQRGLEGEFA